MCQELGGESYRVSRARTCEGRDRKCGKHRLSVPGKDTKDLVGGFRRLDNVEIRAEHRIGGHQAKCITYFVGRDLDGVGDGVGFLADQGMK